MLVKSVFIIPTPNRDEKAFLMALLGPAILPLKAFAPRFIWVAMPMRERMKLATMSVYLAL